jgi:hypothetical protein
MEFASATITRSLQTFVPVFHVGRRIRWPCNDPRHDGRVSHAQARRAVHAEQWVDDREIIHAHFACADGMSEARRALPGKFPDILGGRLGARHDFDLAHTVKGTLISKLTRGFDGAHDGRKIVIRAEIVAIDHGGSLKRCCSPNGRRLGSLAAQELARS